MPNTIAAPSLHNIALNHDFGDSPTGKLAGHSVQSASARPIHAGDMAARLAAAKPLALGWRVMNFVTPSGLRAESKVREALRLTSADVGELLGALSRTSNRTVDEPVARALLDGLARTALPLTHRGADFEQVFAQRVTVHVHNMGTAQLLALKDGLALASRSPLSSNPSHAQSLSHIENTVAQALGKRMLNTATLGMVPILDKLTRTLAQEARQPGSVGFVFDELGGAVDIALQGHGQDPGSAAYKGLKASVLKQFLSDALDRDTENVAAIVRHLPDKEMRALMQVTQAIGEHPNAGIELCVTSAIGSRLELTQAAFMQHAATLLAHTDQSMVAQPKSFRDSVIAAADQLSKLQAQIKTHDLRFPAEVNDKVQQLLRKLDGLCEDPHNLPLDSAAIDNTTLQKFGQALDKFRATHGVRHVDAEISQRKVDTQAPFRAAIQATCLLSTNLTDVGGLLSSLTRFADEGKQAVLARQALDGRGMSSEDMVAFRSTLAKEALQGLAIEDLGAMFATLNSPEMKSVYGSLVDMADVLLRDPETEAVSTRLSGACGQLDELGLLVRTVLDERGIHLPDLPDEDTYDLQTLSAQGHAAISQAFGVEAGQGGVVLVKVATAGPGFQQSFEHNLRAMQTSPESDPARVLHDGRPTGVANGFWQDLLRSDYNITAADGTTAPLINRIGVAALPDDQRDAPMLASVASLRALTGNNAPLLMMVSQFACQKVLAGLFGVIASNTPDSPIQLPDGTRGAFVSGRENTTYHLESDGDGGVLMRIDYNRMGVRDMMTKDGTMQSLNPAASHFNASVELSFTRDQQMTVSDPLIYGYDAQPAVSKSIADVAGMPLRGLASLVFEIEQFQRTHGGPADNNPGRFNPLQQAIVAEIAQQAPSAREFIATFMNKPNGNDNAMEGLALALQMPPGSPVRTELRRQVTQEFTGENLDFLEALQQGRHRTLAGARALAVDMVEQGGANQVNISSRSRQAIVGALAAHNAHTLDAEQLDLIFKDARKDILSLVGRNSIQTLKSKMGIQAA